jgi:hypothetical protein
MGTLGTEKLTYTKAIRAGRLKATEMQIGESVTGTLVGFKEVSGKAKDGRTFNATNIILNVNGKDVEVFPAGNLKFLKESVEKGKNAIGEYTVVTRTDDIQTKNGYTASQFAVTQNAVTATNASTAATTKPSVKAQLEEIRAKGRVNGTNS